MIVVISNVEFLFAQLDRVMLGNYVDNISVSVYYLAYYLMTTLMAVPSSITNVSLPRLSYVLNTQGKEEYLLLFTSTFLINNITKKINDFICPF